MTSSDGLSDAPFSWSEEEDWIGPGPAEARATANGNGHHAGDSRADRTGPAAADGPPGHDLPADSPTPLIDAYHTALLDEDALVRLPPPAPLIGDVLVKDTLAMLYGESGGGKTFVSIDWALSVAHGRAWQDHQVEPGNVLYIAGEGVTGLGQRVHAWRIRHQLTTSGNIRFLPLAPCLMEEAAANALTAVAAGAAADLIVLDTLARVSVGAEENSARDMGELVQAVDQLRRATGATVLLVHHAGKTGESYRGSSALKGAMDTQIRVETDADGKLRLSCEKQKDGPEFADIYLQRDVVELPDGRSSCVLRTRDPSDMAITEDQARGKILALLRESFSSTGATKKQVRDVLVDEGKAMSQATFYRAFNWLVENGAIRAEGDGHGARHWATDPQP